MRGSLARFVARHLVPNGPERTRGLVLEDGSRVAIVGGGPPSYGTPAEQEGSTGHLSRPASSWRGIAEARWLAPLRLRFSPEIESLFREHYRAATLRTVRLATALGCMLYGLFAVLDTVAMPVSRDAIWLIRFGIVCPIFLLVFAFTFVPSLRRYLEFVVFAGVVTAGIGIVAMVGVGHQEEIGFQFYISGLLLVVMWTYGFVRLRFWSAVAANLIILAAYEAVVLGYKRALDEPDGLTLFVIQNFFFLTASLIGMFTGYMLERHARNEFLQQHALAAEREKADRLLLNILPARVASRLKERSEPIADEFPEASVLFADVVEFTPLAARLPPAAVVDLLNELFSRFDALADLYGVEKIKTVGDCYMVAAGVPTPDPSHALRLASLALDMLAFVRSHRFLGQHELDLRIGINSGPLTAGIIGTRKFAYDLWGDTVNTASRMEAHSSSGNIQISRATRDLLDREFVCESLGEILVKGKGPMEVWQLTGRRIAGR